MPPPANTPQDPFGQIVDKLKSANNVLVTVSNNPSADQLAACIGVTLALNKLGKHATAVFSGEIPSAIEFLEPGKTIEANTDSLRDFIIALDKSKADKLRYKVEDEVVKIFITPYKTSISEKDLEFSQGDFNVDAVLALGVHQRSDLDGTIVAHGRILHDAAVLSINTVNQNELGSIDWTDAGASSLCEMASDVISELGKDIFDSQIATALLTGIVAETDRFSNEKASPHTMSISGTLMAAGASTQLVASKLEAAEAAEAAVQTVESEEAPEKEANPDGMIRIEHDAPGVEIPPVQETEPEPEDDIHIDDHGTLRPVREYMKEPPASEEENKPAVSKEAEDKPASTPSLVLEPPQFGGQLTSNDIPQGSHYPSSTDPLSAPATDAPILSRPARSENDSHGAQTPSPVPEVAPAANQPQQSPNVDDTQTLIDIERSVDSAHLKNQTSESLPSPVDEIRHEVQQAAGMAPYQPEPIAGLNAVNVGLNLGHDQPASETETTKPENQAGGAAPAPPSATPPSDNTSSGPPPPPVPPPMMPPS